MQIKKNKYSDYKIFFRPDKINSFLESKTSAPPYVRIKPINLCNHGCFFCAYSTGFRVKDGGEMEHVQTHMHEDMREADEIPTQKMLEILNDLSSIGTRAVTYSGGGEPLMHKDIVQIMQQTLDLGIDLSIITNGQNLVKERAKVLSNAKWVRISMDYTNPNEFHRFRNVPEKGFNAVINNVRNFSKIKNADCDLEVNFIVHKDNCSNLYDFAVLLKNSGVENIRFSPMYIPNFYEYHKAIEDHVNSELKKISVLLDESFSVNSTYNITPGSSHSNVRAYTRCFAMEIVPVIGADLNIYTCHNKAYDAAGCIGSIKNKKFSELWFSDETRKFIDSFNAKLSCMHECSADRKNIILNNFVATSPDNFI